MHSSRSKFASTVLAFTLLVFALPSSGRASANGPGQFPHECVDDDNVCPSACWGIGDSDCAILKAVESAERFLKTHEKGETYSPDARGDSLQPRTEVFRLLHGSQAAGYLDLYQATGKPAYLREATERLDGLLGSQGIWSDKEWDGDLGYVFLRAYDATGRPEYLETGAAVAWRLAIDCQLSLCKLNAGLSAAACMAQAYHTIGGDYLLRVARSILASTQPYQHTDGSFPHQENPDSRNLLYSSWNAFQLFDYLRLDPGVRTAYVTGLDHYGRTVVLNFDSMISLLVSLLEKQVNADGSVSYSGGWESNITVDPECRYCSSSLYPRCKAYCEERCGPPPPGIDQSNGPCWCIEDPLTECGGKMDVPGHPAPSAPDVLCAYCSSKMYPACTDSCKRPCPSASQDFPCGCVTDPEADCPRDTVWKEITYFDEADPGYDTRGWTSELASTAFALARAGGHEAKWKVLRFLFSLQNKDGSFPDKWGYRTEVPGTRLWLWASEEHSAMRTSIVFRVLASLLVPQDSASSAGATGFPRPHDSADAQTPDAEPIALRAAAAVQGATAPAIVRASPNPSLRGVELTLMIPDGDGPVDLRLLDVAGRTVRTLELGSGASGSVTGGSIVREIRWDGADDRGSTVPPGVYFARLYAGERRSTTKIVVLGR